MKSKVKVSDESKELTVTDEGEQLAKLLDQMDVENHWLKGRNIDWETGKRVSCKIIKTTHCSKFVAAISKKLDIPLPRPPEYKKRLLANAQFEWLKNSSIESGWQKLSIDGIDAQISANHGCFVVAVRKNPNPKLPGHIAVVRPTNKTIKAIFKEGPQITQSGKNNYKSTSAQTGFPGTFERKEIFYYGHSTKFKKIEDIIPKNLVDENKKYTDPFAIKKNKIESMTSAEIYQDYIILLLNKNKKGLNTENNLLFKISKKILELIDRIKKQNPEKRKELVAKYEALMILYKEIKILIEIKSNINQLSLERVSKIISDSDTIEINSFSSYRFFSSVFCSFSETKKLFMEAADFIKSLDDIDREIYKIKI